MTFACSRRCSATRSPRAAAPDAARRGRGAPHSRRSRSGARPPRPAGPRSSPSWISSMSTRAEDVIRAFTCYFQLVNLAEERQRLRVLARRARSGKPVKDSIDALDVDASALRGSAHHAGADRPPHRGQASRRGRAPVADRRPARTPRGSAAREPPTSRRSIAGCARRSPGCGARSRSAGIVPSRSTRCARRSPCSTRRSS